MAVHRRASRRCRRVPRTQLRARIPGWGVDLDPADRPSVPRELRPGARPARTGTSRSGSRRSGRGSGRSSTRFLTPVFGTSSRRTGPVRARSGGSPTRYSEGRAAHWLLLLVRPTGWTPSRATCASFATLRPDNPITETGVLSEFSTTASASRVGQPARRPEPPGARPGHRRRALARGGRPRLRHGQAAGGDPAQPVGAERRGRAPDRPRRRWGVDGGHRHREASTGDRYRPRPRLERVRRRTEPGCGPLLTARWGEGRVSSPVSFHPNRAQGDRFDS